MMSGEITGAFVTMDGERYYRIGSYDRMAPFFMNIASDTDLWMFISSTGGLTAGRVDADGAIFPYETVDKIHDSFHVTGPVTVMRTEEAGVGTMLWEPFSERASREYDVERNLYKNTSGNRVVFEEINRDLRLSFRYSWSGSDAFGHVRTCVIGNSGTDKRALSVLDGLRNVLPWGAPLMLHQQLSSLVDAYKRTDVEPESKLGIFSLTSRIIDRAEAAEALRANTVWCDAPVPFEVSLSAEAVDAFRSGGDPLPEKLLTGRRGNYLATMRLELEPGSESRWRMAADTGLSHVDLTRLRAMLLGGGRLDGEISASLEQAGDALRRNVGSADGLQMTGREEASAHHFANVLFNNMRGGVFDSDYRIETSDLALFIRSRNRAARRRAEGFLSSLRGRVTVGSLLERAAAEGDADIERLCHEYLPLYFGRRHGDPSRPWNRFSIHLKDSAGGRLLRYEGNWRDIFQNWEALCLSYPGFLRSVIAKFVNASTVDGFNPYRITREGIDWETIEPDDPWSYIGYWGDHQIIYLLKFLEELEDFYPGALGEMLFREIFSYADVPYRIRPYAEMLGDPDSTVDFDQAREKLVEKRAADEGADGKLVHSPDGDVYHVTLLEKLLVPVLSKLSSLVPDGGIWMNTQRPEWNDANNALVGNGISMVTLCYLRRHIAFLSRILERFEGSAAPVSSEVSAWFEGIRSALESEKGLLAGPAIGDVDRMRVMDALGTAFSAYREKVYRDGFSGKKALDTASIGRFFGTALEWLDHAIEANRRGDGLYHAYNLLGISRDGGEASVGHLYEMLEGQVAALSSGKMGPGEAASLLESLFDSAMYRADQRSFMLYPERELPPFLEKNKVPRDKALSVGLLKELDAAGDTSVMTADADGIYRFNGDLSNAADLGAALDRLAEDGRFAPLVRKDRQAVLNLFEEVFDHRSFTGRSGTMYGYEGLGCIYWHMVSKLLLAAEESALDAARGGPENEAFEKLAGLYRRVRSGLSFEKSPGEYGAFPMDPYSHTPPRAGARQPGMTGQVKEEIIARFGELGVVIERGVLSFRPLLLERKELLEEKGEFRYYGAGGRQESISLPSGSLAFTFCRVPVVYFISDDGPWLRVAMSDGTTAEIAGDSLDRDLSRLVFDRTGAVLRIDAGINPGTLR